jgi:dimethylaniline monooxygenase (N-oxide forming)
VPVRAAIILQYMVWMLMTLGPSGLAILKNFREEGFTVTVFEKRDSVGGVWSYSDDEKTTSTLPCE